jgi:hypothetical protein
LRGSERTSKEVPPSESQHLLSGEKVMKARNSRIRTPRDGLTWKCYVKSLPIFIEEDRRFSLQASSQTTFLPPPAFVPLANVVWDRLFCESLSLTRMSNYVSSLRHFSDVKDLRLTFCANLLVFDIGEITEGRNIIRHAGQRSLFAQNPVPEREGTAKPIDEIYERRSNDRS